MQSSAPDLSSLRSSAAAARSSSTPALVYVLGQPVHAATTESLFVVGAAALVGAADHARIGNIRINTAPEFCALELQQLRDERTGSQSSSCREQRPLTTAASGS